MVVSLIDFFLNCFFIRHLNGIVSIKLTMFAFLGINNVWTQSVVCLDLVNLYVIQTEIVSMTRKFAEIGSVKLVAVAIQFVNPDLLASIKNVKVS